MPLAEFQKELAETHAHRPEVTPAVRAAHLGIQAVVLAFPLAALFVLTFTASMLFTYEADWEAEQTKQTAAVLADPVQRAKLYRELHSRARRRAQQPAAAGADERAGGPDAGRSRNRGATALLAPQRRMLRSSSESAPKQPKEAGSPEAVREVIEWAGAPANSPARARDVAVERTRPLRPWSFSRGDSAGADRARGGVPRRGVDDAGRNRDGAGGRAPGVPAPVRGACGAGVVAGRRVAVRFGAASGFTRRSRRTSPLGLWLIAVALLPVYVVVALRYPDTAAARPAHRDSPRPGVTRPRAADFSRPNRGARRCAVRSAARLPVRLHGAHRGVVQHHQRPTRRTRRG